MGLLDRQRQWEQEQFLKFAGLLSRWRDDPKAAAEQIPQDLSTGARNVGAMTAGLLGDIDPMIGPGGAAGDAINAMGITERDRIVPNSEELVDTFGGDREHFSYYPSMVVAPGPGEAAAGVKGLLSSGKAALASLKGSMDLAPGGLLAQSLFHGTPHKFSKFELEKIGTGEGAQAYGHGLYFAESPGVAKSYTTSNLPSFAGNDFVDYLEAVPKSERHRAADYLLNDFDYPGWSKRLKPDSPEANSIARFGADSDIWDDVDKLSASEYATAGWNDAANNIITKAVPEGHLYEVDIPDETIAKMLDWDAPLSEQPEIVSAMPEWVQQRIARWQNGFGDDKVTGQVLHDSIIADYVNEVLGGKASGFTASASQSKVLNEAGIPGIRFYDGSSRKAQEGTRNIVVFNPEDITQVKRDGELVYDTGKKGGKKSKVGGLLGTRVADEGSVIPIGPRGKRKFEGATVYHSTDKAGAEAIRKGGFQVVGDGYYGEAVSFTDNLDYTKNFGDVTTTSRIKPGAKILDVSKDADFQVWADAQKRGVPLKSHKRGPNDKTWAELIMEAGYDGLYDDGAGDLFIYNPDVIELVD